MRKSLLLGLGGAAILGGWVLKSYLESKGLANVGENLVAANAGNSAQGEKEAFKSELDEFSGFDSENSSLSENFTHKEEKMKMRDLEELQDEALQDRAWMQLQTLDDLDGELVDDEYNDIQDLDDLKDAFKKPYLLREWLASGKLEKWLENKSETCNGKQKSALENALEKVRQIPHDSTRVEATKALYEAFTGKKVSREFERRFELEVCWRSLFAERQDLLNKQMQVKQRLIKNNDDELSEYYEALNDYGDRLSDTMEDLCERITAEINGVKRTSYSLNDVEMLFIRMQAVLNTLESDLSIKRLNLNNDILQNKLNKLLG